MTWPQARTCRTHVHDSDDPLLSIWRVSWIAHILPLSPLDLFNGNIFYPEKRTLAYPMRCCFRACRGAADLVGHLAGHYVQRAAVAVDGAVGLGDVALRAHLTGHFVVRRARGNHLRFRAVPVRSFHHLELQATILPAADAALFRSDVRFRSRRDAGLPTAAFVAQVFSGIYYSVFLPRPWCRSRACAGWCSPIAMRARFRRAMVPAAIDRAGRVSPYAVAYGLNRESLGERARSRHPALLRDLAELTSATPGGTSFMADGARVSGSRRCLFPGVSRWRWRSRRGWPSIGGARR